MDIVFQKNSLDDDISSIVNLLNLGTEHSRVKKYICDFFDLPIKEIVDKNRADLEKIVTRVVQTEQVKSAKSMDEKLKTIDILWNLKKQKINQILCNIFECQQSKSLIKAFLSINCVCPYDFEKKQIYINYRKSGNEMLEICIHELIHYYWFDKWYKLFQDKYNESVVWTFSEIAIDAIFFETKLKQYCVSEYPAHKHFYEFNFEGQNMMEYFRRLYRCNSISEFMRLGIEIVSNVESMGKSLK
ncbi:MAG: hypothetical protein J6C96_10805 [Oscillospiraceae bacterium]|nr:hypothetical protein [Oscillospiraceae bacterium]